MVLEKSLAKGCQLSDLFDLQRNDVKWILARAYRYIVLELTTTTTYVVLQQIEHAHLRQMETFRELLLSLTNLFVWNVRTYSQTVAPQTALKRLHY